MNLVARRKWTNRVALSLSLLAMSFGLVWLAWILWDVMILGIGSLSIQLFTQMTPPPGGQGGLLNAIVGSLIMVVLATLLGAPIGVVAGVYLAEYGQRGWLGSTTRFINDILFSDWQQLAWAGVFLITLGVLAIHILSRVLFKEAIKR
jgi:phosphate transport system permease protein